MDISQFSMYPFQISASHGNNLLGRIGLVLEEIKSKDDIQEELFQLEDLQKRTEEVVKIEILQFAFQQREILKSEGDAGTLELYLETNSQNILEACKSKLKKLSAVAEKVIPIASAIKNKRPDLATIIDEWLDSPFLNALANDDFSEHILQLMQKGYEL